MTEGSQKDIFWCHFLEIPYVGVHLRRICQKMEYGPIVPKSNGSLGYVLQYIGDAIVDRLLRFRTAQFKFGLSQGAQGRCQILPRTGGLLQRGIRPIDFGPLHCPQCMPWDPEASCESTLGWAREIFGSTKPVETSSYGKSAPSVVGLSVFHSYLKHQTCEEYIP